MSSQGTCHAHISSLMLLLCLGFICLLYKALSLNGVSERERALLQRSHFPSRPGAAWEDFPLLPADSGSCLSCSFHSLPPSQFKLSADVPQQSRVPSVRQGQGLATVRGSMAGAANLDLTETSGREKKQTWRKWHIRIRKYQFQKRFGKFADTKGKVKTVRKAETENTDAISYYESILSFLPGSSAVASLCAREDVALVPLSREKQSFVGWGGQGDQS